MTDYPYVPSSHKGAFALVAAWVIGLTLLGCLISGGLWATGVIFAPQIGKGEARKQINSGSSRIAAYNHFFDACASVQTLEGQLAAQRAALATATGADVGRIQANISGIQGARAGAIAEYNADARKGYTIGQFRSSQLPYQLSTETGASTSCVA